MPRPPTRGTGADCTTRWPKKRAALSRRAVPAMPMTAPRSRNTCWVNVYRRRGVRIRPGGCSLRPGSRLWVGPVVGDMQEAKLVPPQQAQDQRARESEGSPARLGRIRLDSVDLILHGLENHYTGHGGRDMSIPPHLGAIGQPGNG